MPPPLTLGRGVGSNPINCCSSQEPSTRPSRKGPLISGPVPCNCLSLQVGSIAGNAWREPRKKPPRQYLASPPKPWDSDINQQRKCDNSLMTCRVMCIWCVLLASGLIALIAKLCRVLPAVRTFVEVSSNPRNPTSPWENKPVKSLDRSRSRYSS